MIHKKPGKKENDDNFGKLCRLEPDKTEIDPTRRAVCCISKKAYDQKKHDIAAVHDPLKV